MDNKSEMQHGSWQKTISGDIEKDCESLIHFQEVSVKILTLILTQIPVLLLTLSNICSVICYLDGISQISLKPLRWRDHQHELEIGSHRINTGQNQSLSLKRMENCL